MVTLRWWNLRGKLPLFLLSFLQVRHFRILLHNVSSASNQQENGMPHISVLSVTLFAITISEMVDTAGPAVSTSQYVDDVAIY
jgi:hypothetical protein